MNPQPGGGMPPWIAPQRQNEVAARDGDVWVSVPIKSGTNWTMNIVHQLLTGGDASFDSIYRVVPWPEFTERPGQPVHEVIDRIDALPAEKRRVFKSHSAPPDLPFVKAGEGKDVKYVVVCRNPEEALVSFKIFLERHTDDFFGMWQMAKSALTRPDFPTFYREVAAEGGMQEMFFGFVASWWPLRHEPNVLLMHFNDMKKDLAGTLRKIASFLEIEPGEAEWAAIEEYSTFAWMKQNESKFETHPYTRVKLLEPGGMIRRGVAGAAREDGMTGEIAEHIRASGSKILTDGTALTWLYQGGAVA